MDVEQLMLRHEDFCERVSLHGLANKPGYKEHYERLTVQAICAKKEAREAALK